MQESFQDATKMPYGYLLCDLKPETPTDFRLRTNIFPEGDSACLRQKGIKRRHRSVMSQLSMAQRLRKNPDFLKLLAKCSPAQRKATLKVADDALVKTICVCVLKVLKETLPVSKPAKRKLLAHKKSLIALVQKSTPLNKKKQILVQHVLRVLSSILA